MAWTCGRWARHEDQTPRPVWSHAGGLLSGACWVGALHPAYDERSIMFDEALIGIRSDSDSEISISVERGEWRSYRIAFTDRTGTTRFTGHLTNIGAARVLNARPEDGLERQAFLLASN